MCKNKKPLAADNVYDIIKQFNNNIDCNIQLKVNSKWTNYNFQSKMYQQLFISNALMALLLISSTFMISSTLSLFLSNKITFDKSHHFGILLYSMKILKPLEILFSYIKVERHEIIFFNYIFHLMYIHIYRYFFILIQLFQYDSFVVYPEFINIIF